ncbi:cation diffusion facilitator family transporter [Pelagicoccus sp. SDUM812003]|uniref:cation diffusion facilitator family transporter n=1 Tax=Pelagicoccus sp. SDUM812003 TaxID=3041267 RepID=UPI00280EFB17|nr:cation diffusion facilitator family transporter [Pelagicoccus sp. SDUM812003]MDQ8205257.1 cation diffusion facilitator family transporter [Pelagicoccus sp. SDUM812003]
MNDQPRDKFGAVSAISNLAFASGKLLVGFAGNSYALIADGFESIADVFSSIVVWNGLRVADKAPDAEHPYGHGKAESIAGLVAACALVVSAIVIGVNAIQEILHPHHAPSTFVVPALLIIIAGKEALFRWLIKASLSSDSPALRIEAWHHRMDSLTSIGVLIGVCIATFAGEGYEVADDIAALLVSGLIVFNAYRLARPSLDELLDRDVSHTLSDQIEQTASDTPGVVRLESLQVRKSGSQHLVDVHLEVDGNLTVTEGHAIAHRLKDRLLENQDLRISHVMTHVEPSDRPRL